jgi:dTDP-glucose 4,6-dehydratase
VVLNALEGKVLPIYGDGKNIRDWLYVKDHCRAIWLIMKQGRRGETYNIGGNSERTNLHVVESICDCLDKSRASQDNANYRELIRFIKDRPGHDRRYAIDASKIREELGWKPEESFESGIVKTIYWYLENLDWVQNIKTGEYKSWIRKQYG